MMEREPGAEKSIDAILSDLVLRLRSINLLVEVIDDLEYPYLLAVTNAIDENTLAASDDDINEILQMFERQYQHLKFFWDTEGAITIERKNPSEADILQDTLAHELRMAIENHEIGYSFKRAHDSMIIVFKKKGETAVDMKNLLSSIWELLNHNESITSGWEVLTPDTDNLTIELRPH